MIVYIAIDDTDDLTKEISTGQIAEYILKDIKNRKLGHTEKITRHQLLLHPDVEYTSHNSSMCFTVDLEDRADIEIIKKIAVDNILKYKSDKSDPGLCIGLFEDMKNLEDLIDYGKKTQKEIITKDEAYEMSKKTNVFLNEYGGSGIGVIGALAGVGLRIDGNDGWYRGIVFSPQIPSTVKDLKNNTEIESVINKEGIELKDNIIIYGTDQIKPLLRNNKMTVLVEKDSEGKYQHLSRSKKKKNKVKIINCPKFVEDNDIEEYLSKSGENCDNCLYRRLTEDGYICVIQEDIK